MTKKQIKEAEEAWKVNPKNPKVVFNTIVSKPLYYSKPLDKPIIVSLVITGTIVVLAGFLQYYAEAFSFLLAFGALGLMNSLVNRNKSWKIFLGVTLISLLGLGVFVVLKLNI